MTDLFILVFLLSLLAFVIGIIKPSLFQFIRKGTVTRKTLSKILLPTMLASFLGIGFTADSVERIETSEAVQITQQEPAVAPAVPESPSENSTPKEAVQSAIAPEASGPSTESPASSSSSEATKDAASNSAAEQTAEIPPAPEPEPAATNTASCNCSADIYNCTRDFTTHAQAQAVYDCCLAQVGYDVHKLDGNDNDGQACESLP